MATDITLHDENGLAFKLDLDRIESVERRDGVTEVQVKGGTAYTVMEGPKDVFRFMRRAWENSVKVIGAPSREANR